MSFVFLDETRWALEFIKRSQLPEDERTLALTSDWCDTTCGSATFKTRTAARRLQRELREHQMSTKVVKVRVTVREA